MTMPAMAPVVMEGEGVEVGDGVGVAVVVGSMVVVLGVNDRVVVVGETVLAVTVADSPGYACPGWSMYCAFTAASS